MNRLIAILILLTGIGISHAQFSLDMETGVAFSGYNDLRIPNNAANTQFSFYDDLKTDPVMYGRANLHYQISPRHEISLLAAPLTVKPSGTLDFDVKFMDKTFIAGWKIDAVYKFNSYRLQYLYRFKNQNIGIRALGLSVKVRDALISLKQSRPISDKPEVYAEKPDLGVVPLIGFEFGYDFAEDFGIMLKGEALASPFGRAEDILLAAIYDIDDRYSLYLGYRFLEGGADVDEVYTFSNFNYASIGTQIRF